MIVQVEPFLPSLVEMVPLNVEMLGQFISHLQYLAWVELAVCIPKHMYSLADLDVFNIIILVLAAICSVSQHESHI